MINYETVLSSFDDKMTLMQWLQKVEEALQGAGLVSVTVTQNTPTTCVLKFNFADGSSVTSASISLPKGDKGDKGDTGATGNGISSISKTGTSGLVDTYTITYTNGNTQTFTVTNGEKGETGETGKSVSSISVDTFTGIITINYTDGSTQADAGHMFYVVNLTGASGTLTDTQYYYLVAGYPNVYIQHGDYLFTLANIGPTSRQYICADLSNGLYQTITVATQTKGWTYQSGQHLVLDVEGDSSSLTMGGVLSTGATAGTVLTADGDNFASWSKVKAGSVDSESATSGQVLQADGSGGASWQNASGGSLYMHNMNIRRLPTTPSSPMYLVIFNFVTNSSNQISDDPKFKDFLYNNNYTTYLNSLSCNGYYFDTSNNILYNIIGIYFSSSNYNLVAIDSTDAKGYKIISFGTTYGLSDRVIQIL